MSKDVINQNKHYHNNLLSHHFEKSKLWKNSCDFEHPVFRNHVVFERGILPGLAWIDVLYQWFDEIDVPFNKIELRNLIIYKPFTLSQEQVVHLIIEATRKDKSWKIRAYDSSENSTYITAEVHDCIPIRFEEKICIKEILTDDVPSVSLEEVYKRCRQQGLFHTGLMKAEGRVYYLEDSIWAKVALNETAKQHALNCLFHPTIIDSSGIGSTEAFVERDTDSPELFLPLYYESFKASETITNFCYVRIKKDTVIKNKEIITLNMEFFDESGQKVAEIENLKNKLVRNVGLINPELANTLTKDLLESSTSNIPVSEQKQDVSIDEIKEFLSELIARKLGKSYEAIDTSRGYYELGLDSRMLLEMVESIEAYLSEELSPTLLFEYTTIDSLSSFISANYKISKNTKVASYQPVLDEAQPVRQMFLEDSAPVMATHSSPIMTTHSPLFSQELEKNNVNCDIAIIGMAGRYPMANNLDVFWENLKEGRDCITQIPQDRWDKSRLNDIKSPSGKSASIWGGFLNEVACFDPEFFKISPREAENTDPQERLFLQTCWEAIENAGYTPQNLVKEEGEKKRKSVGVFVGVMHKDYTLLQTEAIYKGARFPLSLSYAPIANRVSYFCDFHGPSIAIDTVCSSSLTAVHLAIESIQRGTSKVALAGGVNLSLHPNKYLTYALMDMHSSDGYCHTFGEGGDGYVSGEGVGAILLKPLVSALEDGDFIYAVIKGSSINHGGNASGITVPSPIAQGEMILNCLKQTSINPESITYIEAHGTGTSLGDPIEIRGLKYAFNKFTNKKQFCALGSVKSNIGHAESAAGISGLTKTALQIHHKTLVKSLHSEVINPYLELDESPFYVLNETQEWCVEKNEKRRAGVSSFGASGSNAHIILEEAPGRVSTIDDKGHYLVTLSAKNEGVFKSKLHDLIRWLESSENNDFGLDSISFTLNVGREDFNCRGAWVVKNKLELKEKLAAALGDEDGLVAYKYIERSNTTEKTKLNKLADDALEQLIALNSKFSEYEKILCELSELYIKGATIDWNRFYQGQLNQRIPLPTYPFLKEFYWIPDIEPTKEIDNDLHPLVTHNISTFEEQIYRKEFTGKEFYFTHHTIMGEQILPGVAYLEMAIVSAQLAMGNRNVAKLTDISWLSPFSLGKSGNFLDISLYPDEENVAEFEVHSENNMSDKRVYCSGKIVYRDIAQTRNDKLVLSDLLQKCNSKTINKQNFYDVLSGINLCYGPEFQAVQWVKTNQTEVLAEIKLKDEQAVGNNYILHPALLDSALHALLALEFDDISINTHNYVTHLPFSLGEIELLQSCQGHCYVYGEEHRRIDEGIIPHIKSYNVTLFNENGEVLVRIKDFFTRPYINEMPSKLHKLGYFQPARKVQKIEFDDGKIFHDTLIFDADTTNFNVFNKYINSIIPSARCIYVKFGQSFEKLSEFSYQINPQKMMDFKELLNSVSIGKDIKNFSLINLYPLHESYQKIINHEILEKDVDVALKYSVGIWFNISKALLETKKEADLYHFHSSENEGYEFESMLTGFGKSIALENPNYQCKVIRIDDNHRLPEKLATIFHDEYRDRRINCANISYNDEGRSVQYVTPLSVVNGDDNHEKQSIQLKEFATYVITGGLGALGYIIAQYLATHYKANLILIGQSNIDDTKNKRLQDLIKLGVTAEYYACDIALREAVQSTFEVIKKSHKSIQGIFHCAGVIKDNFLFRKEEKDFYDVLRPKILGTLLLDEFTQHEPLDCFILFSSMASVMGNIGQCDYATANAFMDGFARSRNNLRLHGKRSGKTVSINWPLWAEGGMQVNQSSITYLSDNFGLGVLDTKSGIDAFEKALVISGDQLIVAKGDQLRIAQIFEGTINDQVRVGNEKFDSGASDLQESIITYLKDILSSVLKLPQHKISLNTEFEHYGIDSILVLNLTQALEKDFGVLPKTLFFEYQNIATLAEYFITNHKTTLESLFKTSSKTSSKTSDNDFVSQIKYLPKINKKRLTYSSPSNEQNDDIAIIGLSGQYPMANDLQEFWENLQIGKDCITEIPTERWDHAQYFNPDKHKVGTSYGKWGGFIQDYDKFDPLFFNISPHEATIMDPQERLFLQTSWATLEDAGYTTKNLYESSRLGVFVGVMFGHYQLFGGDELSQGNLLTNSSFGSIANRVSYFLNSRGPSMAIDTMCSSSLSAIHLACQSLKNNECEVALAGGVNITSHPEKYILLSQGNFLSSDGRCKSFGTGGDGYVPGEGVGAILLKPLKGALNDKDHIYAVIKGSSINHGGRTNGYTVPNPIAQAELIIETLKKADISPSTINYIEAHGTGTSLGDPIEIRGLSKAFESSEGFENKCPIGSVKSNIGHLESAAGIAGLTKILLQLQHKKLVPSIHSEHLNPNINFEELPFYVQRNLSPWTTNTYDNGSPIPRRAGISSFGAGGSNAHVILEEAPERMMMHGNQPYYLITLSGKTNSALRERVEDLAKWLEGASEEQRNLSAISYTLNMGREHYAHRCAWVVNDVEVLREGLAAYLTKEQGDECFEGLVDQNTSFEHNAIFEKVLELTLKELDSQSYSDAAGYHKNLKVLADLYVKGYQFDWSQLYADEPKQRISLPTYPFAKERYWVSSLGNKAKVSLKVQAQLHPLVGVNHSTLTEQYFETVLSEDTFYEDGQSIAGSTILPSSICIEMARAGGALSLKEGKLGALSKVVWSQLPLSKNKPCLLSLGIYPQGQDLAFEIKSYPESGNALIHAQGYLQLDNKEARQVSSESVDQIVQRCGDQIEQESFYEKLSLEDYHYNQFFKPVSWIKLGQDESISYLQLPSVAVTDNDRISYGLHPSLIEGALQSAIFLSLSKGSKKAQVPVSLGQLVIEETLPDNCYVHVGSCDISGEKCGLLNLSAVF